VTGALVLPQPDNAELVVSAPGGGPGNWTGAPSAILVNGVYWLAYRVRQPLLEGRGVAVVIARSLDGVHYTSVTKLRREQFGAESLERPALVKAPTGWRLYVSCATPGTKHWWIGVLEADRPGDLPTGTYRVCLAGDDTLAVKDPVVERVDDGWRMWVCCHPLDVPGAEDRMLTRVATSPDGLSWTLGDPVLLPQEGAWDARGARVTAVLDDTPLTVYYDGRPTAEDNWFERTGIAVANGHAPMLTAAAPTPASSPHSDGALRYVTVLRLPDGGRRLYYEVARPDGAHDLVTELVPA
jgi:hypothetical protein